jgi:hypothetical protein
MAHLAERVDPVSGVGVISSQPMADVISGIAYKVYKKYRGVSNGIGELFDYPFNPEYPESTTPATRSREVFAQLYSAYMNPTLRAELERSSPVLTQYIQEAINELAESEARYAYEEHLARDTEGNAERDSGDAEHGAEAAGAVYRKSGSQDRQENFLTQAQDKVSDSLVNSRGGFKKHLLGWLTLEQLSDVVERMVDKASSATVTTYNAVMTKMQQASKEIVYRASMIDEKWAGVHPAVAAKLSNVMRTATRYGFDPEAEKPGNDFQQKLAAVSKLSMPLLSSFVQ